MFDGHQAGEYFTQCLLAGICNRVGSGVKPIEVPLPRILKRKQTKATPDQIADERAMARDLFKAFVGQRG